MARGVTSILMKSLQKWTVTVSCVSLKCYADSLRKKQVRTGPVELDEYPPTLYADHVRVHDCVPTLGRLQSRHREAVEAL